MPANRAADLIAARYVVVPNPRDAVELKNGMVWAKTICRWGSAAAAATRVEIDSTTATGADQGGPRQGVSWTGCSTDLKQDEAVAKVTLFDENNVPRNMPCGPAEKHPSGLSNAPMSDP